MNHDTFEGARVFAGVHLGRSDDALQKMDQLLAKHPKDVELLVHRSDFYAELGRYSEAVTDLSLALSFDWDNFRVLKRRGNTLYLSGRYAESTADYQRYVAHTEGADKAYGMLFVYVSRRHAGENADTMLRSYRSQLKSSEWPFAVFNFYLGELTEAQLLEKAKGDKVQTCEAQYYVAEQRVLSGDAEGARQLLKAVAAECSDALVEQVRAKAMTKAQR